MSAAFNSSSLLCAALMIARRLPALPGCTGHKNCAIEFARLAESLGARRLRDEARAALAVHAADSEEARELLAQLG